MFAGYHDAANPRGLDRRIDTAWRSLKWPGLEHVVFTDRAGGPVFDSQAVHVLNGVPVRVGYQLRCDRQWRARRLMVWITTSAGFMRIALSGDGSGSWRDIAGATVSGLDGCIDVDLACTPLTNTLPIRRLALDEGRACDLRVVYVSVPRLEVLPAEQRYTCRYRSSGAARYEYRSGAFGANLLVDRDGLVIDYPGVWKRIAARRENTIDD